MYRFGMEIYNLSESIGWSFLSRAVLYIDYSSDFMCDLIYFLSIGFLLIGFLKYLFSVIIGSGSILLYI